tara:strand:+ start:4596 stop:5123 length:528 start_codon:yes stop_codon:yes gene_type:complete
MGQFAVSGLRFIAWRGAILGAVQASIQYRPSRIPAPNEARYVMTKRGAKMQTAILTLLRSADGALSAYDVLHALQETHPKIAPPTIYNALAALAKAGSVHRVESLKAYVACQCTDAHHSSVLSICGECGTVEECIAPQIVQDLSGFVEETGFQPQRHVIEVHGKCSACSAQATRA